MSSGEMEQKERTFWDMALKKVCIIGHFGFGKELLNGQTVKAKILAAELQRVLGEEQVLLADTHGGVKALLKLPLQTFRAMRGCENVVILPAHKGLRIVTPMLSFWRLFFKRRLHYAVIGGWLAGFLEGKKGLEKQLKKFTGIYAETNTMKKALEGRGFPNVYVMPNCKQLTPLEKEQLPAEQKEPYRLCTFSRVMEQKGIGDAVAAVKNANAALGRVAYALDIYGPVDGAQTQWFQQLQTEFPDCVRYGGAVPFDKSVEVLKDYFALLFPTKYYTEGIPGTVIDAYAAGVPVISARWESFSDLIDEGITGYGYEFGSQAALEAQLEQAAREPERILKLKENCLLKARDYIPENAVAILLENMEGQRV